MVLLWLLLLLHTCSFLLLWFLVPARSCFCVVACSLLLYGCAWLFLWLLVFVLWLLVVPAVVAPLVLLWLLVVDPRVARGDTFGCWWLLIFVLWFPLRLHL